MRWIFGIIVLLLLCCAWSCGYAAADVEVVLSPNFGPIPASVLSSAKSLTSTNTQYTLVSAPQPTYLNDSAAIIAWVYNGASPGSGFPSNFKIELAYGPANLDFEVIDVIDNPLPDTISGGTFTATYTIGNLEALSTYSVRVIPVFTSNGAGFPSLTSTFTTLAPPVNYWEAILPRRSSKAAFGRGFGGPLSTRPILDEGVEVFGSRTHESDLWYSDTPTNEAQVFPSGRRGHSWTLVDGVVYMFGGRTNGYSCASTVMDTLDLGAINGGLLNYPCALQTAEVNELWSFDINTFVWTPLNTTNKPEASPLPREQHSAVVIGHEIYVFGGKSRFRVIDTVSQASFVFANQNISQTASEQVADHVFGDLWKLVLDAAVTHTFHDEVSNLPQALPQDTRLLLPITPRPSAFPGLLRSNLTYATVGDLDSNLSPQVDNPRNGICIEDVTVSVTFSHPCLSQVQLSMTGPGPQSASANYFASGADLNVRLMNAGLTRNADIDALQTSNCISGTHTFVFNDAYTNTYTKLVDPDKVDVDALDPSIPTSLFELAPAGQLAHFLGHSPLTNWTLIVEDISADTRSGTVYNWSIAFETRQCFPRFTWVNLTSTASVSSSSNAPVARYAALSMAYDQSIFVFGGRDQHDHALVDLHRFDLSTQQWTALTPAADFYTSGVYSSQVASSVGANYLLTIWGLFRFAGYYRDPISVTRNNGETDPRAYYDNRVYLLDPVTQRWDEVDITRYNASSSSTNPSSTAYNTQLSGLADLPMPRYLSAALFLPASSLHWQTHLYRDALLQSVNVSGTIVAADAASKDRLLFDRAVSSLQSNYQSSIADSLLVFGGFDATSSVLDDGSAGGLFHDLYLLRLNTLSTQASRADIASYRQRHCRWRSSVTATRKDGAQSCLLTSSTASARRPCKFRDLLMLAWCAGTNQSMR